MWKAVKIMGLSLQQEYHVTSSSKTNGSGGGRGVAPDGGSANLDADDTCPLFCSTPDGERGTPENGARGHDTVRQHRGEAPPAEGMTAAGRSVQVRRYGTLGPKGRGHSHPPANPPKANIYIYKG